MDMSLPSHVLEKLIQVFNTKSIYMLGAGASYSYIKPEYGLYDKVNSLISDLVMGAAADAPRQLNPDEEQRFEITIGSHTLHRAADGLLLIDDTYNDISSLFIRQNPEILEICGALEYSVDLGKINFCPEYSILNFTNRSSLFLNFNHDHLAETFIKGREILSMHGTITPQIRLAIQKTLPLVLSERYNASDIKGILLENFCLATQEYEHTLINNCNFRRLQHNLAKNTYNSIIIIGYSFFKRNSYSVYDVVTYDLIRAYLYENKKCEVIIVDPEPEFAADILANNLSNIRVCLCPIFWNAFTKAYFNMIMNKKCSCMVAKHELQKFNQDYYRFV